MQAARNIDKSLAEVFGNDTAAYKRGIGRIVERAHELAKKDT